jgi:hypothetical protein
VEKKNFLDRKKLEGAFALRCTPPHPQVMPMAQEIRLIERHILDSHCYNVIISVDPMKIYNNFGKIRMSGN